MCLIFLAKNIHPDYPLIVLGNRDEFYHRPTQALHKWDNGIVAGKDLEGGGTWMGIHENGRIAFITNHRKFPIEKKYNSSRGHLVSDFLSSDISAEDYLKTLINSTEEYDGYNLVFGNQDELYYFSNRNSEYGPVPDGIHGISNAFLNTSWPKVDDGKAIFSKLIKQLDDHALFELMKDKRQADDNLLPDTGVGFEKEKQLSAKFIEMDGYGTRVTTLIKMGINTEIKEIGWMPSSQNSIILE